MKRTSAMGALPRLWPSLRGAGPAGLVGTLVVILTAALLALGGAVGWQVELGAGDPQADRALVDFHKAEQNDTDIFRWSEPRATIFLYGVAGRPALVDLRLTAPRSAGAVPAELSMHVGAQHLGRFAVVNGWRHYYLLLPTDPDGETALALQAAPYVPDGDAREVGVVISDLSARPTALAAIGLPVRTIFLLTLPLLVWLFAWRAGLGPHMALLPTLPVMGLIAWAAAAPISAGYWLPTIGWPWWPALPLLLLLGAPALWRGMAAARARILHSPALGWVGLAVALLALIAMRLGVPAPFGLPVFVVGVLAGLPLGSAAPGSVAPTPTTRTLLLSAVVLFLLGLALRLVNLDGQPAGLWRDESRHGLLALRIWDDPSFRPVYVVAGADLPALLFYLMAPVLGTFGPQIWSLRLVSVVAGALTPLAIIWAGAPLVGRRAALIGAALYAWASWGLSMSRWAFPATLDHLLVLTAVGLAWRGSAGLADHPLRIRQVLMLALAGFCAALATYAYHTGRMAPIALAVLVAIRLGPRLLAWRRALPGLLAAAAVGLLVMAPLLAFIAANPDGYNRRVGTVSVFDSSDLATRKPLGLLLRNGERYALMWHVRGEGNGRHHLPGAPMLDPLAGLLLAMGIGLALTQARRNQALLALLALWLIYFVPGLFSSDAPHAMRSLGTLAPACLLAGLSCAGLVLRLPARRAALLGLLALSLTLNSWIYFGAMRVEPRVYGEFDLVETAMGRVLRAAADSADPAVRAVAVYLPPDLIRTDTVRFLSYGTPPRGYPGGPLKPAGDALVLLPADTPAAEQQAALAALGAGAVRLPSAPTYPGTDRPIVLALGRGPAAARLLDLAWP